MKILSMPANFPPEQVSSTQLDLAILDAFSGAGWETVVFPPVPTRGIDENTRAYYIKNPNEERNDGMVKVCRFPLMGEGKNPIARAYRYLLSNVRQYRLGIGQTDTDVVFGDSTPPTQGLLCALVKRKLSKKQHRKVSFVYELQDIFPDSLVNAGMTGEGSLLFRIGRKMEDFIYRNADAIIVISEGFRQNLLAKGVPNEKIRVIPNWADTASVCPIPREKNPLAEEFSVSSEEFVVVYAGNCGETQGADVIVKAAKLLAGEKIRFLLFGAGSCFEEVKREAVGLENIGIYPLLPVERVSEVYSLGDIALITCKRGVGGAGLPSKTWNIMACNTPIVASFDKDSDLARAISDAGCGCTVDPENPEALAEAIRSAAQKREKASCRTREYVERNASREVCVKKYKETVEDTARL